jgi:hypothetical protein
MFVTFAGDSVTFAGDRVSFTSEDTSEFAPEPMLMGLGMVNTVFFPGGVFAPQAMAIAMDLEAVVMIPAAAFSPQALAMALEMGNTAFQSSWFDINPRGVRAKPGQSLRL